LLLLDIFVAVKWFGPTEADGTSLNKRITRTWSWPSDDDNIPNEKRFEKRIVLQAGVNKRYNDGTFEYFVPTESNAN
jgi:hypothetical protein